MFSFTGYLLHIQNDDSSKTTDNFCVHVVWTTDVVDTINLICTNVEDEVKLLNKHS